MRTITQIFARFYLTRKFSHKLIMYITERSIKRPLRLVHWDNSTA